MKILMTMMVVLGISGCSLFSGDDEIAVDKVPSVVKNTFSQAFPDAVEVEWEKYQENYEADFEVEKAEYTALLSPEGLLLMHKQEVSLASLPEGVQHTLQQHYAEYSIEEAEKIERDGNLYFQVELEGKIDELKEVFNSDGKIQENVEYWD